MTNTEEITSDVINSLVHLENQYNKEGNIIISEVVYNELSNRLKKNFQYLGEFENKKIFKFYEE